MTGITTNTPVIVGEFDENNRLVVRDDRDNSSAGKECASTSLGDIDENGVLTVVGVKNTGPYKGDVVTLPGGMKKGRGKGESTSDMEDPFETAREEAGEEAGARNPDGSPLAVNGFYPVLHVNVNNEPLRNQWGERIMVNGVNRDGSEYTAQKRGVIPHFVFAHFGPVLLHETTGEKTKEPRRFTLNQMIRCERGRWSPKHVVLTVQTLRLIGEGLVAYRNGEIEDERDYSFYDKLWQRYALSTTQRHLTIQDWMEGNTINGVFLDPHSVLYYFFGNERRAKDYLHPTGVGEKFKFFPGLHMKDFDITKEV